MIAVSLVFCTRLTHYRLIHPSTTLHGSRLYCTFKFFKFSLRAVIAVALHTFNSTLKASKSSLAPSVPIVVVTAVLIASVTEIATLLAHSLTSLTVCPLPQPQLISQQPVEPMLYPLLRPLLHQLYHWWLSPFPIYLFLTLRSHVDLLNLAFIFASLSFR